MRTSLLKGRAASLFEAIRLTAVNIFHTSPELAAGSRDVPAPRFPHQRCIVMIGQHFFEALHYVILRPLEFTSRKGVKRDEINLTSDAPEQLGKAMRIRFRIIHIPQHHVFKRYPSSFGEGKAPAGGKQLLDGVAPVHRHDPVPHFVRCRIQGHGKVHLYS